MKSIAIQLVAILAGGFIIGNLVSAWINAVSGNEFGTFGYGIIQALGTFWGLGMAGIFFLTSKEDMA